MTFTVDIPAVYLDSVTEITTLGLYVVNTVPEAGSIDASDATAIYLELMSTDIAASPDLATITIQVKINDGAYQDAYTSSAFVAPYNGVGSITNAITGGRQFNIVPTFKFSSEDVITVRVVASTTPATYSIDETYSFTIADLIAPELLSAQATGPQTVQVVFSESMLSTDASGANDALNPSLYTISYEQEFPNIAAVVPVVSSVTKVSGTTFDLNLDMILTFGKPYRVTGGSIADDSSSANLLAAGTNVADFNAWIPPSWPDRREFNLYSFFSRHDHTQDTSGDLEKLCSIMQDSIDIMLWLVDDYTSIFDVETAPEAHVDAMLVDMGNPFQFDIDLVQKRKLLELLVPIYQQKGTAQGIINLARFFIGLEILAITPFLSDSWILGDPTMGILGESTWLAPSDQAAFYSFQVVVSRVLTDEERIWLTDIINEMKCAHEHAYIVEPTDPAYIDHWDLGQSTLGDQTLLHA